MSCALTVEPNRLIGWSPMAWRVKFSMMLCRSAAMPRPSTSSLWPAKTSTKAVKPNNSKNKTTASNTRGNPLRLGRPIQDRRQNVSDDARQHERQQNQFGEIEKDGQDDRADHDGAGFSGIERAGGTGALDHALLVAALTRQFHE